VNSPAFHVPTTRPCSGLELDVQRVFYESRTLDSVWALRSGSQMGRVAVVSHLDSTELSNPSAVKSVSARQVYLRDGQESSTATNSKFAR